MDIGLHMQYALIFISGNFISLHHSSFIFIHKLMLDACVLVPFQLNELEIMLHIFAPTRFRNDYLLAASLLMKIK